jgi:hypothetical protein
MCEFLAQDGILIVTDFTNWNVVLSTMIYTFENGDHKEQHKIKRKQLTKNSKYLHYISGQQKDHEKLRMWKLAANT